MATGDPFLAGTGGNLETGADPGNEAQAALGGALAGGAGGAPAPAAAPAAAPPSAGPGGSGDVLAGIQQLMGALNQPQQVPAAAVQQRHGGVLTGLAGILLDGLAAGIAPTREAAAEAPMRRQQQQMQMQQMALQQQQAQQEMAMAPIRMKAQMAQAAINILQAGHMMRELSKEHQIDMLGAQGNYMKAAIDEGRAHLDATAPTLDAAQKRTQELQAANKNTALNYGYYPTKWDDQGHVTEYGVYEAYPHGALQKDFDYDFAGDTELGIKAEHVHLPAGMQESEARLKLSAVANEHSAVMKLASDRIAMTKFEQTEALRARTEAERERSDRVREDQRDRQLDLVIAQKGPVGEASSFGQSVYVNRDGTPMMRPQVTVLEKTFEKEYGEQIETLQRTVDEFQRINSQQYKTGADRVTAMMNAVAISMGPLKGMARMSHPVMAEHETARSKWQDYQAKWNKLVGEGGPITDQQIASYTKIATGVLHDAYVRAAQKALQEHLPVDFLPKPMQQGQVADNLTAQIYKDVARGDNALAYKEMQAAGWR